MIVAALLKGFILGLLLAISVGPIIFAIIKQSIKHGHKGGYAFIAGISASDITLVLICNIFASLFASMLAHEKQIAIAGCVFFLILGIYSLFFKKPSTDEPHNVKEKVFKRHELVGLFLTGFLMNSLNPGALFFWFLWSTAILADSKSMVHPEQYRFIVFITCLVVVLATDVAKVLLAGKLRTKLTAKVMHRLDQVLGVALIVCAIILGWGILFHGDKLH
jgi:threonine/homoserine/homoserine lactone efflux protein